MKKLFYILFAFSAIAVSAQPCFNMVMYSSPIGGTNQIVSADFNADGKADLAAVGNGSVMLWFGTGTGTFTSAASYAVAGGTNYYLCTGDFNNDGRADIATANFSSNSVSVLLNAGSGTFSAAVNYNASSSPMSVCAGDFNKDGNVDLAAACASDVSVLLGTGGGLFGTAVNYAVGGGPNDLCTTDFTADGNLDLAVVGFNNSQLSLLSGSSTGAFSLTGTFTTGGNSPAGITKVDFNNDGKMDVAVCNEGSNNFSFLLNNGSGFNPGPSIGLGAQQQPRNIASADFDGNGTPDFVMADFSNFSPYYASIAYNGGSGIGISTGSGTAPHGVCTGDFNNDGKPDFAIANQQSSNICVFLNNNPIISLTGNMAICAGQTTTITASGANTYTWSSNAGGVNTSTVSVNPTATTQYTITGNTSGCGMTATTVATVTVLPAPSSLTLLYNGNSTICQGQSTQLKAIGDPSPTTYQWLPGNMTSTLVTVSPSTTTLYTVTETNTSGCSLTGTIQVNVNPSPTVTANASQNPICVGSSVTLTGGGATSYTWSGGVSNGLSFTPTTTATYTVTGSGSNGCTNSAAATVTVNPLPVVNANASATNVCVGTMVTLTGSGTANTYTWTGGVSNGVPFPATSQTYTVTGVDANNCANTATISIVAPAPLAPAICMVTVDSLSINNLIIWDKTLTQNADTFFVYRDTANNNYALIAKIPHTALSQYIDTTRSIGAVNGDPNITTYRYKLAYKDTCGNVSPLSPYHNTIYNYNIGSLFLWNQYQIEGQGTPVAGLSNYVLKRDNLGGTGNYVTAATAGASSTSINDPQYSTWQTTADWRVETVWNISCTPSVKVINGTQGTVVKSKSNITNNKTTNISRVLSQLVSVYPNPGSGLFAVHFNSQVKGELTLVLVDAMGREIFVRNVTDVSTDVVVDLSDKPTGVYLLRLQCAEGSAAKRIIKQ